MAEKKFTEELRQVFDYIKETILKEYECDRITTEYFVLSVLENANTVGNKILSKIMLYDNMQNAKAHFYQWLSQNVRSFNGTQRYDETFEQCIAESKAIAVKQKSSAINSGHVLMSIISNNTNVNQYFRSIGVTLTQVSNQVAEETTNINEEEKNKQKSSVSKAKPIKHVKKVKKGESDSVASVSPNVATISEISNKLSHRECDLLLINLNKLDANSGVETIYGNEGIYKEIFSTLSKRNKNNIILTGRSGVGKTDTVRYLAHLINEGKVPKSFRDKVLYEINFNNLFVGTQVRGSFEAKVKSILNEAKQSGKYIFFIDAIHTILNSRYSEYGVDEFIERLMQEKDINLICTCSDRSYAKEIGDYPHWNRYFEKIEIDEPDYTKCIEILKQHGKKLEYYHDVRYDEDVYDTCIKYCKRYITDRCMPDAAIDILDKSAANVTLSESEDDGIKIATQRLQDLKDKKSNFIRTHSSNKNTKRYQNKLESLEKEEIELQTVLNSMIKSYNLQKHPLLVTSGNIKECISQKTGIELKDLTADDKEILKTLNEKIKKSIIGQNDAVDAVCKSIKRQRIGISDPNKPVVFLMAGSTGVGKSYLAKVIAKEVYGDEKKMVRLDMAEYADKTAVNKILGSSAGYIGYNDGGVLTEALKRNKNCVLLLDEIEKADEEVHNTFLSLFDEGRLTDSQGNVVDCRNIIVFMTSNVGAKEVDERGNGVGFITNTENLKKEIIEKELKRKFKPEFINRIDKIVYFNKLTDENLKSIIKLEINKLRKRLENIGYGLDYSIEETALLENIFNEVKKKKNQGARPIMREIQTQIEDKITDFIIDNNVEKGYVFKAADLMS